VSGYVELIALGVVVWALMFMFAPGGYVERMSLRNLLILLGCIALIIFIALHTHVHIHG